MRKRRNRFHRVSVPGKFVVPVTVGWRCYFRFKNTGIGLWLIEFEFQFKVKKGVDDSNLDLKKTGTGLWLIEFEF